MICRIIFVAAILIMVGCHGTITKYKEPVFAKPAAEIELTIDSLVKCERINLNGTEVISGNSRSSELLISITNGRLKGATDTVLQALGKKVAVVILRSLKDSTAYNDYRVFFVTRKREAGVTKSNWRSFTFPLETLRP